MNHQAKYTAEEIFEMFKEEHRLCSPLDFMAYPDYELSPTSSVLDWRDARDLLDREKLVDYFNKRFQMNVPYEVWDTCFEPEDTRTIMDVCQVIAAHATRQTFPLKKLLGRECATASVFLGIKNNLRMEGIDVANLRPSSEISPYLLNHFGPVMEQMLMPGVRVFDELTHKRSWGWRQNPTWFEKIFMPLEKSESFELGSVKTFRDAVNRICAQPDAERL